MAKPTEKYAVDEIIEEENRLYELVHKLIDWKLYSYKGWDVCRHFWKFKTKDVFFPHHSPDNKPYEYVIGNYRGELIRCTKLPVAVRADEIMPF